MASEIGRLWDAIRRSERPRAKWRMKSRDVDQKIELSPRPAPPEPDEPCACDICCAQALPMLEAEAKERLSRAGGDNRAGKEKIPEVQKGQARDKAAALVGVNPR
jgi:hypothetical protein